MECKLFVDERRNEHDKINTHSYDLKTCDCYVRISLSV